MLVVGGICFILDLIFLYSNSDLDLIKIAMKKYYDYLLKRWKTKLKTIIRQIVINNLISDFIR